MKKIKLKFLIFIFLASSFFISRPALAAPSDVLTVAGNKFMLNGAPIILSGVAMGDPHDRIVNYQRSSQADYFAIKNDWQANVVRLSVHPGVFLKDWVRGKKILEDEAAVARANGLIVIIDWHVIGRPDGWYKEANPADKKQYYSYNSDFNLARQFWQYTSEKFKDDRGIIFELWNEPVNQDSSLSWPDIKPYLSELVELIRQTNSQNVILAPGVYWSYDLRGIKADPLSGDNIAYSWHVYNNGSSLNREDALDGLNQIYPVFITEWGSNNEKDFGYSEKSGQNVYGYLESVKNLIVKKELSYTAWCWHSSWKPTMFESGWLSLNSYGSLVKDFLNYPGKVKERLLIDEQKRKALADAAAKPAEKKTEPATISLSGEFKLRLKDYLNYGADANSSKFNKKERQAILANFVAAFGHEPANENEWQDLIRINNGYWPSKVSQTAEAKAAENFKKIFKRAPDLSVSGDKHAIKILAYGIRQRDGSRSIGKERAAINRFKKIFKRAPKSEEDWNFMRAIAYGGVKN